MKKIAIACLHYGSLTGSEMYFYELIKLLKNDFKISLYSNINHIYSDKTIFENVKYYNLNELNTQEEYDFLVLSHGNFIYNQLKNFIKNINFIPIINICHSEVLPQENPILLNNVKYYVGIRPSIVEKLHNNYKIPKEKIKLIYNPIDMDRFNTNDIKDEKFGLFIGTMNHLRINPFLHFLNFCKNKNLKIVYIGDVPDNLKKQYSEVKFLEPVWEVEKYIKSSTICGGIINGRTFWEAKLCGKEVIEYNVNSDGSIINFDTHKDKDININDVKKSNVYLKFLEIINYE